MAKIGPSCMMTFVLTSVVPSDTDRLPRCKDAQHELLASDYSNLVADGKSACRQKQQDMQQTLHKSLEGNYKARLLLEGLQDEPVLLLMAQCGKEWQM